MNQNELKGQPLSSVIQMGFRELNEKNIRKLLSLDLDLIDKKDPEVIKLKDFLLSLYSSKESVEPFYGDLFLDINEPEPAFVRNALVAVLTQYYKEVLELDSKHKDFVKHLPIDERYNRYEERANAVGGTFIVKELENLIMYGTIKKPRFNLVHFENNSTLFGNFIHFARQQRMFTEHFKRQLIHELDLSSKSKKSFYDRKIYGVETDNSEDYIMTQEMKSMTRLRRSMKCFNVVNKYSREQWLTLVKNSMNMNFEEKEFIDTMILWSDLAYTSLHSTEFFDIKVKIKNFGSENEGDAPAIEHYEFNIGDSAISGFVRVRTNKEGNRKFITWDIDTRIGVEEYIEIGDFYEDSSQNDEESIKSKSICVIRGYNHIDHIRQEVMMRLRLCIEFE